MGRESRVRLVTGPGLTIQWALFCLELAEEHGGSVSLKHVFHTLPMQPPMNLTVAMCITGAPNHKGTIRARLSRPNGAFMDFPEEAITLPANGAAHFGIRLKAVPMDQAGAMIAEFVLDGKAQKQMAMLQVWPSALPTAPESTTTH